MTTKGESAEATTTLREWVKPGDTVYTILRHVSRSGMQRVIGVVTIDPATPEYGSEPVTIRHPNYMVAQATGWRLSDDYDGVKVGGAGMDMGFHLVYTLSRILFPDGFDCVGEHCPSNAHSNGMPRPSASGTGLHYYPMHHTDGGYALRQRWL